MDIGLLEYLSAFITEDRMKRFEEVLEHRTNWLTVAIEDVYQLHNTSAVIRSCDIFGIQQAHLIERRFGERLDKNIAMGAEKWVDTFHYTDTESCMNHLKGQGYEIVATSPHANASLLDDFKLTGKTVLFFGTEKEGLSPEVMEQADRHLKIPMYGFTESLNISVSAAILLARLSEQLRTTSFDWKLSEEERLEKRLDWTKKSIKSIDSIMERYDGNQ
ncbi:TrmH family RNA methyltransferase [Sediminicola luteus]|uniref:tRNA (guanosine(18)-2'-O)-methyltransferase n=1 Tax=Sediminicola luteus TaxID=319238 RepID=A0A2A4G390_9FLAO|nr:RNA methyltransferase [Sediminicola luteus]PCE62426.1 rRNA methyltransferase [Sediminicola luteus]